MGNFSRSPEEMLDHAIAKNYVGVRLQQGVPLLDADWNELEDLRRYELRNFIKSFVGSGVPVGDDGFYIQPIAGNTSDFIIKKGQCIVDGLVVCNQKDTNYKEQELYKGGEALAAKWGVEKLGDLQLAADNVIYLDVWEREVSCDDDPKLLDTRIGVETCVRVKRDWVVRCKEVVGGDIVKSLGTPQDGHVYYPLWRFPHGAGETGINNLKNLRFTDVFLTKITSSSGVEVFQHSGQQGKYTSGAIDPGLGAGNLLVYLGVEGTDKKNVVGDPRINDVFGLVLPILGAQIDPNTGTFVIGLKLEATDNNYVTTRVRWWAFRPREDRGEIVLPQGIYVTINSPPVVVNPGVPIILTAVVHASENQSVVWSLIEIDGGTIDSNTGQYTPGKPGIFHIRATSVADASKFADIAVTVNNCVGSGPDCVGLGQPGVPQHCTGSGPDCTGEGQPGVPCTTQGKSDVPCTTEGQAGIPCTTPGKSGVPCTTEGQAGIPCTTPGKSGVPKPCTGSGPDNNCDVGGPDVPKPCKTNPYVP